MQLIIANAAMGRDGRDLRDLTFLSVALKRSWRPSRDPLWRVDPGQLFPRQLSFLGVPRSLAPPGRIHTADTTLEKYIAVCP